MSLCILVLRFWVEPGWLTLLGITRNGLTRSPYSTLLGKQFLGSWKEILSNSDQPTQGLSVSIAPCEILDVDIMLFRQFYARQMPTFTQYKNIDTLSITHYILSN